MGSRPWPRISVGAVNVRRSLPRRRDTAEEQPLHQRAARPRFLADDVEHDVAVMRKQPPGNGPRHSCEGLHHRFAEGQRDEQRREGEGAAE